MDKLLAELKPHLIISTVIYAFLGMLIFGIAFAIFNKLMPFSVRKEIEEDQNTALAVIMGSVIIGVSIIIAAALT